MRGRWLRGLDAEAEIPVRIVHKEVATSPESIRRVTLKANASEACAQVVVAWMHTFSPAKMWIAGLSVLQKPFLHLHTQYEPRNPLGGNRHEFHEPEPVRARRP